MYLLKFSSMHVAMLRFCRHFDIVVLNRHYCKLLSCSSLPSRSMRVTWPQISWRGLENKENQFLYTINNRIINSKVSSSKVTRPCRRGWIYHLRVVFHNDILPTRLYWILLSLCVAEINRRD